MKNRLTGVLLLLLTLLQAGAQRLPCGNGKSDPEALRMAMDYEAAHFRNGQTGRVETVNYFIRVFIHVFQYDDGTNPAATPAQIVSEFAQLQSAYSADAICFLNAGVEYISNGNLDSNFNADSDPNGTALAAYQAPNCINVFYMKKIRGNNTACNPPCGYGGIALGGIPGTFCLVSTGNIGAGNTIAHEVGHCLGLFHTFEKNNGFEKIDGTNSATAADKITDTPADPFAYNGQACYSSNGCTYTGTCPDPNGQTNFSPPYSNLMSYWSCLSLSFTNGQYVRINSFLATNAALIGCLSPLNVTVSGIGISSGYYTNSAMQTLSTSGTVIFSNTTKAALGGTTVLLEPGFRASPAGNGQVLILTKPCN